MAVPFWILTSNILEIQLFVSLPEFGTVTVFSNFSCSNRCVIYLIMVQICISLVANDAELVKHLFNVGPLYNWVNYHRSLYILDTSLLQDSQIYSSSQQLNSIFCRTKSLSFIIKVLFYACLKTHCQALSLFLKVVCLQSQVLYLDL